MRNYESIILDVLNESFDKPLKNFDIYRKVCDKQPAFPRRLRDKVNRVLPSLRAKNLIFSGGWTANRQHLSLAGAQERVLAVLDEPLDKKAIRHRAVWKDERSGKPIWLGWHEYDAIGKIISTLLKKNLVISVELPSGHKYMRNEVATEWLLKKLDEIEHRVVALEQESQ